MNKLISIAACAALLGVQVTAAAPAAAADLLSAEQAASHEMGTFVGARFRMPLNEESAGKRPQPRLTLAAGPTIRSLRPNGAAQTRFGSGLEFGVQGEALRFDLAGKPVSRIAAGGDGPQGRRSNLSTLGWVAIGVGTAAVTVLSLYVMCGTGAICNVDDE
jgi:hypothetical protein